MWGHKAQRYISTFCTGPEAHIAYEEDIGDHGNPGSCAEDNPVLG